MPQIVNKVTRPRSDSILEITHVSKDGDEVNLQLPGTNLEWYRVKTDTLTLHRSQAAAQNLQSIHQP